jgi:predicted HicB family RNase H-like nuclease
MGHLKYKGYTGNVEFDEEDDCLSDKVLGMVKDSITYEGNTVSELKPDFQNAIDSYIEGCREVGIAPRKPVQRHSEYTYSFGNSWKGCNACRPTGHFH